MKTKKTISGLNSDEIEEGEELMMKMTNIKCEVPASIKVPVIQGELIMTNYKIVFKPAIFPDTIPKTNKGLPPFLDDYFSVPLCYINRIDKKIVEKKRENTKLGSIEVTTKDYRWMKFDFDNRYEDCTNAHNRIQVIAFPENEMQDIFALKFTLPLP